MNNRSNKNTKKNSTESEIRKKESSIDQMELPLLAHTVAYGCKHIFVCITSLSTSAYCVGIDKEKEIVESACTEIVFCISFLQFCVSNGFGEIYENPLIKLCFCSAFCF